MRLTVLPIITLLLLTFTSVVSADQANINVTSSTVNGRTKVDIKNEGDGTYSSVKINGEEWKVEGPGEIHVDKNTNSNSSPTVTQTPTPTISKTPTPTPTVLSDTDEEPLSFFEIIKRSFQNFFLRLFGKL